MFKGKRLLILGIVFLVVSVVGTGVLAAVIYNVSPSTVPITVSINSTGGGGGGGDTVHTLNLYSDSGLSTPLSAIDFGAVDPDVETTVTVYFDETLEFVADIADITVTPSANADALGTWSHTYDSVNGELTISFTASASAGTYTADCYLNLEIVLS